MAQDRFEMERSCERGNELLPQLHTLSYYSVSLSYM
jgi:hypothetical protein